MLNRAQDFVALKQYEILQFSLIPTGHKLRQCAKKESSKVDVISGWADSKRGDI